MDSSNCASMDSSKQNELFQSLMEIIDNVKDKLNDSEYLKAMEILKSLKLNFEVFQKHFIPIAFLALYEYPLPENCKILIRSFIVENANEKVVLTAFKDCTYYMNGFDIDHLGEFIKRYQFMKSLNKTMLQEL